MGLLKRALGFIWVVKLMEIDLSKTSGEAFMANV
ncbi:hypothetical protein SLEP1_g27618 [Rubroshorea leprosula]|uniref:Uncharacterized protein n=1 Tax=Rubroshorea leprosula TaxID=152421 RepID=A0AAV5K3L6_9ROSI|nr:hypothetical protein SLEP1_g27618 [Rubroshorea leprosula]